MCPDFCKPSARPFKARRIPRNDREASFASSVFFIAGDLFAAAALLANGLLLGVVWPYLAALVWGLSKAAIAFARLILLPLGRGAAG